MLAYDFKCTPKKNLKFFKVFTSYKFYRKKKFGFVTSIGAFEGVYVYNILIMILKL